MRPPTALRAPAGLLCALLLAPALRAADEEPVVARVEVQGNQFLQKETLLFYVTTKPGDRYDEKRLRDDFRRLWDTGFLEDGWLDVRDTDKGKLVTFNVRERKRIQIVDYRGSKELTATNIEDKLKEKDALLRLDSFYDVAKAQRVSAVIKELLEEKGRHFGTVKIDAKALGASGMQVSFVIDDGPPTRVKDIVFVGNKAFSSGTLKRKMSNIKEHGFFNLSWISSKDYYTEEKWSGREGDHQRLENFYLSKGYATVQVGQPKISYFDGDNKKKPEKWMRLEIPISEGDQYRVGDVSFEGLSVFKEDDIRPLFKVNTGEVYDESKIQKGYEELRDAYGSLGYFQWTSQTKRNPRPDKKTVDLVISMEEDKRYYVGKINFTGNDTTRDKVVRREVYLTEGDVFNTELLKLSIRRINQLGYFKPMEGVPQLAPNPKAEDKLDVTFKLEEQNRNQFTFGAGVSGLEGFFVNASFQTANFLGLGETFTLSAQSGGRTTNYQLAITEPYFLDRPITAGIDLYKRRLEYQTFESQHVQGYVDDRVGVSLITGMPVGRWSRAFVSYSYEIVTIETVKDSDQDPLLTPTIFNPFYVEDLGTRQESKLTPSIVYNTVDNPWTPRSGLKLSALAQLAGGPLGGTVSYFKPNLEAIAFVPHWKRTALGLRAEAGWVLPYGTTGEVDPKTGRNRLPFYQRFRMGGETQIRGYNVTTVGPRDANGNAIGGNKFVLFNAEYYIDIAGPLRGVLFFDAGQAFLEDDPIDFGRLRTSTGVELRFIMPVLNVPFRLVYAWNPHRDDFQPATRFGFFIGTTF